MKKPHFKTIAVMLVLILITVAAAAPIRCPKADAPNWMAQLEDTRPLHSLAIPGTHDSGALYSFAGLFGKCQSLTVSQQLDVGVRYLDLRLRLVDEELLVYHNFVEQKTAFADLLQQLVSFVEAHPTEFLIVSFKEEDAPIRSQTPFSDALEAMLLAYPDYISDAALPDSVGAARGKIHILARYENGTFGTPCVEGWQNNSTSVLGDLYVQDHYKLQHAEEKLPDIEAALAAANSGQYRLVLNHTSCYLSSGFPPSYAGTSAHTVNPWLQSRLQEAPDVAGVLICDFMTSELATTIIGRNFS